MLNGVDSKNPIDQLAKLTGGQWANLSRARAFTQSRRNELQQLLSNIDTSDTSIVVFGSLARDEATEGSDTDWTLLVDGIADPLHVQSAHEIRGRLQAVSAVPPGPEGTFGELAFSHQILHWIGGEDDSNANTTRRMLLLLESKPLGQAEAWHRVLNNVLSRYLKEDRGLWNISKNRSVPLFLLNDLARYWRIMVVDFAYKQRSRGNRGYALRSIKLGLSRKLIFVSGLLACYSCGLDFSDDERRQIAKSGNPQALIAHLRKVFDMTPLEILADRLCKYEAALTTSKKLFDAYDRFVGLLAENELCESGKSPRKHLEDLAVDKLENDVVFREARKIRRDFGECLNILFLKPGLDLYDLTVKYGVF
jgi:predicted nucleotidyltransferase